MSKNVFTIPQPEKFEEIFIEKGVNQLGFEDYFYTDYDIPFLKSVGANGQGVTVFVLDTGIDFAHEDFKGANINRTLSRSFVSSEPTADDLNSFSHGTAVASIIIAQTNNIGIKGVAEKSELIAYKVLGQSGSGSLEWLRDAMNSVVDFAKQHPNKKVIANMSLGSQSSSSSITSIVVQNKLDNLIWVAACGNRGVNSGNIIDFPARIKGVLAVGSVNINEAISSFSSRGDGDIVGAGENVLCAIKGNRYARVSGTSFSSPHVAGIIAAIWSKFNVKSNEVLDALAFTAKDLGQTGKDNEFFLGKIQPKKMYEKIMGTPKEDTKGDRIELIVNGKMVYNK